MALHTAREIGAAVRARRTSKGWTQEDLAAKVGVSRDWVSDLERGASNPRLNLLLRCLAVLDLGLGLVPDASTGPETTDLDAVLSRHRGR
jgi:HTH-type transcriptional regulator/antitoxin HipB